MWDIFCKHSSNMLYCNRTQVLIWKMSSNCGIWSHNVFLSGLLEKILIGHKVHGMEFNIRQYWRPALSRPATSQQLFATSSILFHYILYTYLKCVAFLFTSPKHSDIPIATFQLSLIVLNNSLFQNRWFHLFFFWIVKERNSVTCLIASCSSTAPQNWQESVPKRIISTASTASCSHRWFSQAAALSPPFFKHSCLWRNATTIWDAEGHMSAILMEDDELVQIHSVRIPENLGRTHLDPKSKQCILLSSFFKVEGPFQR